jgi:hypothetical protein
MSEVAVDRIAMPSPAAFYRDYMCKLRPVVIADLFAGEPIRGIATRDAAIAAWSDVHIDVQNEYGTAYRHGCTAEPRSMTFARYYEFVEADRTTTLMAIEFPTPPSISAEYAVPKVCHAQRGESPHFVNQCFIGNQGNRAQIHFDKAGLHGFLYQVFGRKRCFVFPHEASPKLAPVTQVGSWHLHNFSDEDRNAFLRFTGGAEVVLGPGDCLYVPSLSWHAVDYLEDSMSISLRFRRSNRVTTLVNALFPDMYLLGIAFGMADPQRQMHWEPFLREIEEAAADRGADGIAHVRRMRELARSVHMRMFPDFPREPYILALEDHMPSILPHFLDANHPDRPIYE